MSPQRHGSGGTMGTSSSVLGRSGGGSRALNESMVDVFGEVVGGMDR